MALITEKERRELKIQVAGQIAARLLTFELLAMSPEQAKNALDIAIFAAGEIVDKVDS